MSSRAKKDHLELFRGLAILAVLMIHVTSYPVVMLPMHSTLYPLYHIVNTFSHFAVPAFIFLSALVMFYQYDDARKHNWSSFYFKRFQVIAIPYLLWSIFYYALVIHIEGKTIGESWLSFLTHLLIGSNYAHLYFIVVIVQFYLLFPLLHRLLYLKAVRSRLLAVGIISQLAFYLLNYQLFAFEQNRELLAILSALLLSRRLCRASHTVDGWNLSEQAADLLCLASVSRRVQLSNVAPA